MSLVSPDSVFSIIATSLDEKLAQEDIDVPMLPEVAGRVIRLTQDPESDATALAKLIQSDQTLAGHVMRVANSSAYSPNGSIVSLQQAIARLGMQIISEIALSASINSSLFNAPGFEEHIFSAIKYSLATSLWSKEVARTCRRNVETAFISGLLHDIGRPVATQSIVETAKKLNIRLSINDLLSLEKHFKRLMGIKVVNKWNMPASVINAVTYFDDYKRNHETIQQTMIVVAGSKLVNYSMDEDGIMKKLSLEDLKAQTIFGELDLYHDDIDKLLEKQEQVASSLEAMSP